MPKKPTRPPPLCGDELEQHLRALAELAQYANLTSQDLLAAYASRERGMMPIIRSALELTEPERELAFGLICTLAAWRPQRA
jgi:hypothetical protein